MTRKGQPFFSLLIVSHTVYKHIETYVFSTKVTYHCLHFHYQVAIVHLYLESASSLQKMCLAMHLSNTASILKAA